MRLKTDLLPHQIPAVDKLLPLRIGALYMEMGTGKTRTALEIIQRRLTAGKLTRVLWLCPCSVKASLAAELAKHAQGWEDVIRIAGIESLSGSARLAGDLYAYVSQTSDCMLVVDESNLVKNHMAIRSRRVTVLAERCKYRMILNGTPISRNEADLYSQWYLLDWRVLGYRSYYSFAANHLEYDPNIPGKVRRTLEVDYLVRKIAPYSYQVFRRDCFPLPPKTEMTMRCYLTPDQDKHYGEVAEAMLDKLSESDSTTIYRMFSALQAVISGLWVKDQGRHFVTRPMFASPMDNPRIGLLLEILDKFPEDKALIFCKYTHEIETILGLLGDRAVGFYGGMANRERQASLAAFAGPAQYMVANKVCAGYGLNLQHCHRLVYYSNDWDYATRAQSEDRVHRYGQTQPVEIWDIVARETLDEKILRCLGRKEGVAYALKRELNTSNDVKETLRGWVRMKGGKDGGEGLPESKCI